MKIRIEDDSIRLRLSRPEVDALGAGEAVARTTHFPGGTSFHYRLAAGGPEIAAQFGDGEIAVLVPQAATDRLAEDDTQVGIYDDLSLDAGALRIKIEKDFECLEPREGEDQSNRFANPKASA